MPITVDEVTAEVAPPQRGGQGEPQSGSQTPSPSDLRRQREQLERMQIRSARVHAD